MAIESTRVRCPACNSWFVHPGRKRRWCSDDCARQMRNAAATCASRLQSADRSIDQTCIYCDKPLGPMDITGRTNMPGRRESHEECRKLRKNEVVGECRECGATTTRRDAGCCHRCRKASHRELAKLSPTRCAASYESFDTGEVVRCEEDAYPTMEHCSKHRGDMRSHGEFRDWLWRWDEVSHLIPQAEIPNWRDHLLDQQRGRCGMFELCGKDESNNDTWHLDHDHSCDRHGPKRMCPNCVRGVLCWFCNVAVLGALEKDDMSPLDAARAIMHYLESGDQLKLAV